MNYFVTHQNHVSGPFPLEELQARLQRGEMSLQDQVCQEGALQWVTLQSALLQSGAVLPPALSAAPPKKKLGCAGCLLAAIVVCGLFLAALVGSAYYVVLHTTLPFQWVLTAFLPRGAVVKDVTGSFSSGFNIGSIRWPGPNGETCEIEDARFLFSGLSELQNRGELIIRDINVSKAHVFISSTDNGNSHFSWHASGDASPFPGSLKLFRIDRVHFGDVHIKDTGTGFELIMPTLDYTGFKIENGKIDLGNLQIVSDRLEIHTEPGRTMEMAGKTVAFQKHVQGTVKPELGKWIKRPIDFSLDIGLTAADEPYFHLVAFDHRLDVFRDEDLAETYHAKDLPLSSYLEFAPYDLPSTLTVDGTVPGVRSTEENVVHPPRGSFTLGQTDFTIDPGDVAVLQNGASYQYYLKAFHREGDKTIVASLKFQSEIPRLQPGLTSVPPMPASDLLARVFHARDYASLSPADRKQIDAKVPLYFSGDPPVPGK